MSGFDVTERKETRSHYKSEMAPSSHSKIIYRFSVSIAVGCSEGIHSQAYPISFCIIQGGGRAAKLFFAVSFTADQRTKKEQPWERDHFFGMLLGQHGSPAFHPHLHQKLSVLQDGWLVSVSTYLERDRLTKSTSTEHSMVIQLYLQERKVNRVGAAALTNVSVYCTASKITGVQLTSADPPSIIFIESFWEKYLITYFGVQRGSYKFPEGVLILHFTTCKSHAPYPQDIALYQIIQSPA